MGGSKARLVSRPLAFPLRMPVSNCSNDQFPIPVSSGVRLAENETLQGPTNAVNPISNNTHCCASFGISGTGWVTESGTNGDRVGSCLFLDGRMTTVLNGKTDGIVVNKGQQNFKYDPNHEFSHWGDAETSYHIVHFSIDPQHFISFLPQEEPWADNLMNKIVKRERVIGDIPAYISLQQHKAIQILFDCPMSGKMAQILMETSVIQIVIWQMHALFRDTQAAVPSRLAPRDREIA